MLLISSTNRPASLTLRLSRLYLERLSLLWPQQAVDLLDLHDLPSDFIGQELYGKRSAHLEAVESRVRGAERIIFVLPEYNGSLPGILKLWIDALTYGIFAGKKAALVGLSAGMFGNVRGLDHLCEILNYLQVNVLPYRLHIARADRIQESHADFYHEETIRQIDRQIGLFQRFG